eukprot:14353246-Heterocapsa_arctica.AAC.1
MVMRARLLMFLVFQKRPNFVQAILALLSLSVTSFCAELSASTRPPNAMFAPKAHQDMLLALVLPEIGRCAALFICMVPLLVAPYDICRSQNTS